MIISDSYEIRFLQLSNDNQTHSMFQHRFQIMENFLRKTDKWLIIMKNCEKINLDDISKAANESKNATDLSSRIKSLCRFNNNFSVIVFELSKFIV